MASFPLLLSVRLMRNALQKPQARSFAVGPNGGAVGEDLGAAGETQMRCVTVYPVSEFVPFYSVQVSYQRMYRRATFCIR